MDMGILPLVVVSPADDLRVAVVDHRELLASLHSFQALQLPGEVLVGKVQHPVYIIARNRHYAVVVPEDQVSRDDGDATALDRHVDGPGPHGSVDPGVTALAKVGKPISAMPAVSRTAPSTTMPWMPRECM